MRLCIRQLGRCEYLTALTRMREYTDARDDRTPDELWLVEHPPVFTLGQSGKREHILAAGDIPVIQSDRGGQVTFHGPGQLVLYVLLDLRRAGIGVRQLVSALEASMIAVLADHDVEAVARPEAPGVYVVDAGGRPGAKIGSLGLRVRRGRSYHGLSLNCDMDLEPFQRINPCGLIGQEVTQLSDLLGRSVPPAAVAPRLCRALAGTLGLELGSDALGDSGKGQTSTVVTGAPPVP